MFSGGPSPFPHPYVGNHYSRISTPQVIDKNLISLSTQTGGWGTLREAGILNTRVPREPFPAGPGASDLETMPWGEGSTEALEDYWVPERTLIPAPCGPAEARWRGRGGGGARPGWGGALRKPSRTLANPAGICPERGWDRYSQKPAEAPPQLPNHRIKGRDCSMASPLLQRSVFLPLTKPGRH